jgi:hypothetical protein
MGRNQRGIDVFRECHTPPAHPTVRERPSRRSPHYHDRFGEFLDIIKKSENSVTRGQARFSFLARITRFLGKRLKSGTRRA